MPFNSPRHYSANKASTTIPKYHPDYQHLLVKARIIVMIIRTIHTLAMLRRDSPRVLMMITVSKSHSIII